MVSSDTLYAWRELVDEAQPYATNGYEDELGSLSDQIFEAYLEALSREARS